MPANPYVSVPAGTPNQQSLWVQAYYRNLALQNAYQQQRGQYGDALALGLGKGLGAGLDQFFGQWDQTNKFNNASALQSQQDQAQAWRQQQAIQQQNDLQAQREQAAAEAEQRKAIIAQILEQQRIQNIGAANAGLVQGMQPQPQPDSLYQTTAAGNEPPVFQGGQEQSPQTYTDLNSVANPPIQPQLGDVLSGLASRGLGGYVDKSLIEKYVGQQGGAKGLTDAEELARFKEAQAVVGYDPAAAARLLEGTRYAGMQLTAQPVKPETNKFLSGQATAAQLTGLLNLPDTAPIFQDPSIQGVYGRTPAEIKANVNRQLFGTGGGTPQTGGLYGYEAGLAGARAGAAGLAQQGLPMKPNEASLWINPQTFQSAAGLGISETQARQAGMVPVTEKQREYLDQVLDTEFKARAVIPLLKDDLIGPVMGRTNYALNLVGKAPPGFADLLNYLTELKATVQRLRAGAQVGPREEIYVRNLPDYNDAPEQFRSALSQVLYGLSLVKERIVNKPVVPGATSVKPGQDFTRPTEAVSDRFERARKALGDQGYAMDDDNVQKFLLKNPGF